MKYNMRRLLSLVMALAMLMTAFALAEEVPVEVEGETGIGGESGIDTAPQGLEDEMAIDLDLGESILDLETEGELSLDLNGGLETSAEELAPETEVAMNAGDPDGTEQNPYPVTDWETFALDLAYGEKKRANESKEFPTHFQMNTIVTAPTFGDPPRIIVSKGRYILLDLNGCTLNRKLSSAEGDGFVIKVSGTLTIMDKGTGGKITGGSNTGNGGGVFVENGGTFTMTGGTIGGTSDSRNNSNNIGGGVCVAGTYTMEGGTISGNSANNNGGGVAVSPGGRFIMKDGTIGGDVENSAPNGGGVCLIYDYTEQKGGAVFEMRKGNILNNRATNYGGGVRVDRDCTFTMSEGIIRGN